MTPDATPTRNSRWTPLWIAALMGVAWLSVETAHAVMQHRVSGLETVWRFLAALPWQLAFFGLLAVPAVVLRMSPVAGGSWVLGFATLIFTLVRLLEGLLKRENLGKEHAAAWLVGAVAVAALPGILVWLRRFLPRTIRPGYAGAIWAAWMLAFVPTLQRTAPTLSFARMPANDVLFHGAELVFAAVIGACVLVSVSKPRVWALTAMLLVAPLVQAGLSSGRDVAEASAGATPPNVILVVVDTLRADHLFSPEFAPLTPKMGEFLQDSIRFSRAYTPGNRTLAAMPGVMTSLPSISVGEKVSEEAVTFAEHMKGSGYSTVGVSSNPLVSRRTGYSQGFDVLSDSYDWPSYQVGDLRRAGGVIFPGLAYRFSIIGSEFYYRPGSNVRQRAFQLIEGSTAPTFLYLHTMDMHGPYLPPRDLLEDGYDDGSFLSYFAFLRERRELLEAPDPELEANIENLQQRYVGELRLTDSELGLFFDQLREAGLYEDSLIWLLSDHGESFGERGFAGHGGPNTTPSVLRVPLAMKPPRAWGLEPRSIDGVPVSTFDILPTTLSLLGLPAPKITAGSDLSPLIRGGAVVREFPVISMGNTRTGEHMFAFVEGPWQLDIEFTSDGQVAQRHLYSALDPKQTTDFKNLKPRVAIRLEKKIRDFVQFANRARAQTWENEFDQETQEQLRRLGYIE